MKYIRSPLTLNMAATVSAAFVLAACGQVGCGSSTTGTARSTVVHAQPSPQARTQAPLQASPQPFAFRLWNAQHGSGNDVLSPMNIETALAMTYAGARGSTALEMGRSLAGEDISQEDYLQRAGAQYSSLDGISSPGFELRVANRLFLSQSLELEPSFSERLRSSFASSEEVLDFSAGGAHSHINGYIAEQTNDRIRDLLSPGAVNAGTQLVLTSAIYLDAKWQVPFEAISTVPAVFHTGAGDVTVPTMHQTEYFAYSSAGGVELAQLPYQGGRFSAVVVLPNAGSSLESVEASLSDEVWQRWTTALDAPNARRSVALALPKFRLSPATANLSTSLASLGMASAFSPRADFSGMSRTPIFISAVFHKAFIEVDETGTEAAAATAVVMTEGAAVPPPSQAFDVDRPFLFVVRDLQSNGVVFVARVVNPAL